MRKSLLLMMAACCASMSSFATVHTIHVADFAFTPSTMPGVHVGDTVKWIWDNGSHTTTSTTIPAGAAAWDNNLKSSSPSFSYVPTVAGTYNYKCDPHSAMGMVASFTVLAATSVEAVTAANLFSLYPNPVASSLHIQFAEQATAASVTMYDMTGREVLRGDYKGQADINVSGLAGGVYLLNAKQGNQQHVQTVVVRH